MRKKIVMLGITFLAFGCLAWAGDQAWKGVVSDSHCGVKHSAASDAAAGCVAKCVSGGAKYVLVSGDKVYQLDAQDKFKDFEGKAVKVKGTMTGDSITVTGVKAAGTKKTA